MEEPGAKASQQPLVLVHAHQRETESGGVLRLRAGDVVVPPHGVIAVVVAPVDEELRADARHPGQVVVLLPGSGTHVTVLSRQDDEHVDIDGPEVVGVVDRAEGRGGEREHRKDAAPGG